MADRGEYRPIYSVLPDSPEFQALSKDAALLLYTVKVTLGPAGIGVLYDDQLAERARLTREEMIRAREELIRADWLLVDGRIHWLRNGLRFEPTVTMANENHKKSIMRHLKGLPKQPIVNQFAIYYGLDAPFPDLGDKGSEGGPEGVGPSSHVEDGVSRKEDENKGIEGDAKGIERGYPITTTTTTTTPETNTGSGEPVLPSPGELEKSGSHYDYPDAFEEAWGLYPTREGGNPKKAAYRAWRARVNGGVPPPDLRDGVERYREYCEAKNTTGSQYVMQASTFFGPDEHWKEPWDVEEPENTDPQKDTSWVADYKREREKRLREAS